jgi:hypothetical protein
MSRVTLIMQALKQRLEQWRARIMKVALLNDVTFEIGSDGTITATASWKTKLDEGQHQVHLTRERVFGRTLSSPQPRIIKRPCDFRDDIIREVLQHRMKKPTKA